MEMLHLLTPGKRDVLLPNVASFITVFKCEVLVGCGLLRPNEQRVYEGRGLTFAKTTIFCVKKDTTSFHSEQKARPCTSVTTMSVKILYCINAISCLAYPWYGSETTQALGNIVISLSGPAMKNICIVIY